MAVEALNPTVEGALIGSGAALIAVILTTLGTFATLRANRTATRDERLWERRTDLYETLIEIGVSDRPLPTIKELLAAQEPKVFAYASDPVLIWFTGVHGRNKSRVLRVPKVSDAGMYFPEMYDIAREAIDQDNPDEYADRAMVMRLVNAIRDELQGQRSLTFEMWARTFLWRAFGVRDLPRRRAGR